MSIIRRGSFGPNSYTVTTPIIVGDVHGCIDELREGIRVVDSLVMSPTYIFVGDLVDRGPKSCEVVDYVSTLHAMGSALCVRGNHDDKAFRAMKGNNVIRNNGLDETMRDFESQSPLMQSMVREFLRFLPWHVIIEAPVSVYPLTVVAHAGIKINMVGINHGDSIRSMCLYGQTTGEKDENGYPVRLMDWTSEWNQEEFYCVYGHTPHKDVVTVNNTTNIDTGCAFGGKLTFWDATTHSVIHEEVARAVYCDEKEDIFT